MISPLSLLAKRDPGLATHRPRHSRWSAATRRPSPPPPSPPLLHSRARPSVHAPLSPLSHKPCCEALLQVHDLAPLAPSTGPRPPVQGPPSPPSLHSRASPSVHPPPSPLSLHSVQGPRSGPARTTHATLAPAQAPQRTRQISLCGPLSPHSLHPCVRGRDPSKPHTCS